MPWDKVGSKLGFKCKASQSWGPGQLGFRCKASQNWDVVQLSSLFQIY